MASPSQIERFSRLSPPKSRLLEPYLPKATLRIVHNTPWMGVFSFNIDPHSGLRLVLRTRAYIDSLPPRLLPLNRKAYYRLLVNHLNGRDVLFGYLAHRLRLGERVVSLLYYLLIGPVNLESLGWRVPESVCVGTL